MLDNVCLSSVDKLTPIQIYIATMPSFYKMSENTIS